MAYNTSKGPQYIKADCTSGSATEVLRLEAHDNAAAVDLTKAEGTALTFYVPEDKGSALGAKIVAQREADPDTNTQSGLGFWTYANNESGAERMRIDFQGNVGVGTTAPSAKFEVAGSISGSSTLEVVGNTYFGGTLNVTSSVGVGTSPSAPLHVYKAATSQKHTPDELLRLEQKDEGVDMSAGHGPALTFYVGETGGSDHGGSIAVVREAEGDADSAAAMSFYTAGDDSAPTEKARITSTGKFGIGTAAPTHELTVAGAISGSSTLKVVGAAQFGSTIAASGSITTRDDILPFSDNTKNLGSAAKRWANIYTGDLHLKNERGDWTVVEEEEYLSLRNNKTGKRYKLSMEEID